MAKQANSKNISNLTMQLFGLPYQFPKAVDPRIKGISGSIGRNYIDKIMLEAPVCTIIPGMPAYLAGSKKGEKFSTALAMVEAAEGALDPLKQLIHDKKVKKQDMRIYDFKSDYTNYMNYVNVLCRAGASFLNLDADAKGLGYTKGFQSYDWKMYRWNERAKKSMIKRVINNARGKTPRENEYSTQYTDYKETGYLKDVMKNYNYVQFFVDPDNVPSDGMSNNAEDSMIKGLFESGSSMIKDMAFIANSGGIDPSGLQDFTTNSAAAMTEGISKILGNNGVIGSVGTALSRILSFGGEVLHGNNIIFPKIYKNSDYSKGSMNITVHLKTPYGTKLGYYLDIFVPLMHILALVAPRQETANSFSSPFLVKAYIEGVATCNLGIVESVQISRVGESRSVAGLPSEVDVNISIVDLYSNLMLSPANAPVQFLQNSSLIEYIATSCGLDLTSPNFDLKMKNVINTTVNSFKDIPTNIKSTVDEKFNEFLSSTSELIGIK